MRPQSLHRILGKAQRLDKVIAGAAAGEQKRKPAAGQAVDDLKKRAVATDGDNARHIFFYSLSRVRARLNGAFSHKCAVGDALAAQERLHARKFALAASVSRDGVDDQCVHRPPQLAFVSLSVRKSCAPPFPNIP